MGWNFRKTINLGGGFRINFSKRGIGASAGVKGFRIGLNPRGKNVHVSIPGTGIYYRKNLPWGTQASRWPLFHSPGRLILFSFVVITAAALIAWLFGVFS